MSILDRVNNKSPKGKKLFGIVAGARLAGKTTLVGTLPGKTLLLQATIHESGSESAVALAKKSGNQLDVVNFDSITDLETLIKELRNDKVYDNVVVDSLSAVTEMKYSEPAIKKMIKIDNWAAFREIGECTTAVILALKELTYPDRVTMPKNTFLTCALSIKLDKAGVVVDVSLDCKGNVATSNVTKYGEAVVIVAAPLVGENGAKGKHRLLTKSVDVWPARIDGILDEDNPGIIEPASLTAVLALKASK
jgi:hypothetical protein